ncbi:MAG: DUF4349 domain-containing protein [Microscillaceae bacterium]|nr:DUF4349 domain-containing protein [Microscillaceae bacterium]
MNFKIKNYLFGLLISLAACSGGDSATEATPSEEISVTQQPTQDAIQKEEVPTQGEEEIKHTQEDPPAPPVNPEFQVIPVQQVPKDNKKSLKIIKTANLRFEVKNLEKSMLNIQQAFRKYDAYIASANQQRSGAYMSTTLVMRVEVRSFEALMEDVLKESVDLVQKDIQAQDVTEAFVDIQARLKTKKKVEERYLEILQQAKTIEEILQVENQIRQIREEIEAQEGRLKYLSDQTRYSTITIEMYEANESYVYPEKTFFSELASGFYNGWEGILAVLIGLVNVWPLLVLIIAVIYMIRKFRWRKKIVTIEKPTGE